MWNFITSWGGRIVVSRKGGDVWFLKLETEIREIIWRHLFLAGKWRQMRSVSSGKWDTLKPICVQWVSKVRMVLKIDRCGGCSRNSYWAYIFVSLRQTPFWKKSTILKSVSEYIKCLGSSVSQDADFITRGLRVRCSSLPKIHPAHSWARQIIWKV